MFGTALGRRRWYLMPPARLRSACRGTGKHVRTADREKAATPTRGCGRDRAVALCERNDHRRDLRAFRRDLRSVGVVYAAIGVTVDGHKDVLGLWMGAGGEGATLTEPCLRGRARSARPSCEAGSTSPNPLVREEHQTRPPADRGPPSRTRLMGHLRRNLPAVTAGQLPADPPIPRALAA
jgi:hypothetical protein